MGRSGYEVYIQGYDKETHTHTPISRRRHEKQIKVVTYMGIRGEEEWGEWGQISQGIHGWLDWRLKYIFKIKSK